MRIDSIIRLAILSGVAFAAPLLGDTYGQPARQNWSYPQDNQIQQSSYQNRQNWTNDPQDNQQQQQQQANPAIRRQVWSAPAQDSQQMQQANPPARQNQQNAPAANATFPQRFDWRASANQDSSSQTNGQQQNGANKNMQQQQNDNSQKMNPSATPAVPATSYRQIKATTPVRQATAQARPARTPKQIAEAVQQNQGQTYWSPNQAQRMSDSDYNMKKNGNANVNSQTTTPNANDIRNPASYYKTEDKNLYQKIKENPSLSTFLAALEATGLADQISNGGPYTIFAPSNDAFRQLPRGTMERLFRPENQRDLYMIISYHIAPGKLNANDARTQSLRTLNGRDLDMQTARGTLTVDDAEVIRPDIQGQNGVIHVIDAVLLPSNQ